MWSKKCRPLSKSMWAPAFFSSPVTECHRCYRVCTLSPLRAVLTMRFTKNTRIKTSISCEPPQISHFAASKSTFSYEFSYEPTPRSTFRARLPSIFHHLSQMPRLPRNLHLVTTAVLTMRFANNTQHDTSKVLCLPRKIISEVSKVLHLPRKMQRIF